MSTARALLVVGVAMILLAVGAGYWFVTAYDTAGARCQRGDLGACSVIQAQRQAQLDAEAAQAAAERQAAIDAAAAVESELAQLGRCFVRANDHNATIRVSGAGADESCALIANFYTAYSMGGVAWAVVNGPGASDVICTLPWVGAGEQTVTVLDTGAAYYGGLACDDLALGPHD